jgi:hypothetical protein
MISHQWEYRTLRLATGGFLGGKLDEDAFDGKLNELGQQGWELVAAFDTSQGSGQTRDVVAVFKRPR